MKSAFKRTIRVILFALILPIAGLGVYTWRHISPAGPEYQLTDRSELPFRLRTNTEHDAARTQNGGNPYILDFETPDAGALLYYGASHISDPKDPQSADITARWNSFHPTVALYEGRARNYVYGALIEPFAGLPEPALVHKLARRHNVPLYTLEPSFADEVSELLGEFAAEQVALYFFLRVYVSEADGQFNERLAFDLLRKRTDVDGLRGVLRTLDDVTRAWRNDYPDHGDWWALREEPQAGILNDISDSSQRVRGEHMIRTLVDLVARGERVFAVVGSGHVIRQEWNLRSILGQEPAWDQPLQTADTPGL